MKQKDPAELIRQLRDALALTKIDAERNESSYYGNQSNCVKAIHAADRWLLHQMEETADAAVRRKFSEPDPLGLPIDFMEYGPKTASLTLMFRNDAERARFVAALERAGVKRRSE